MARPRVVGLVITVLVVLFLGAPTASAAEDQGDRAVTRYDVDVKLARDGTARVRIDFDFDFASTPGHGPYVTLPLRQEIFDRPDKVRAYPVSDVSAESPSGAPANVYLGGDDYRLDIRIGDEDVDDVSGVQRYILSYTVRGLVNPGAGASGEDEFYWNVIGVDWVIPLSGLSATVDGPGEVIAVACFAGATGGTDACTSAQAAGATASFTEAGVGPHEPFTVVVGYPAGTFVGAEPIIEDKPVPVSPFGLTPVTGGLSALVLVGVGGWLVYHSGRRGRDQQYLGLTPGNLPAAGQPVAVGAARRAPVVAVQFAPPAKVRPGEVGTLVDETADPKDVVATIVDLAVRGYLRIEEVRPPGFLRRGDWRLHLLRPADADLAPYERRILDSLFEADVAPTLASLRTRLATTVPAVRRLLYQEVTGEGWFRANPDSVRNTWRGLGIVGLFGGGFATSLLAERGFGLVGVAVALLGGLTFLLARRMPARTAKGSAVLAQTLGFKRYLETAEANQIRFEEGEDVFSRYLPYAVVFGVAERWVRVFEELARQGAVVAAPAWYHSAHGTGWTSTSDFASSFDSFAAAATSTVQSATSGSSGRSGFGGGGSSGGGGGGGGGGGW